MPTDGARLTSGQVSRLAGVPQQTLIRWDRSGVLKARRPRKQGPRSYDANALAAALFSRFVAGMGFSGSRLAQFVRVFQEANPRKLKRWVLYSFFTECPGLISHDGGDAADAEESVRRHIEFLRERGRLIAEPATFWTIREHLMKIAEGLVAKRHEILGP